jgi:hypothetical protein
VVWRAGCRATHPAPLSPQMKRVFSPIGNHPPVAPPPPHVGSRRLLMTTTAAGVAPGGPRCLFKVRNSARG